MGAETDAFEPRGVPAPSMLANARAELHWAAQIVAAVGRALIPAAPDDSHTSLEWLEAKRSLVGGATPLGLRLGLRPGDLTLVLQDPSGAPRGELPLAGRTLEEARSWTAGALGALETVVPPYAMPPHPVARGGRFTGGDREALAELERWYAAADGLLREVRRTQSHAPGQTAPVRCWPHHLDIAMLLELPPHTSVGTSVDTRTLGVGLSPGDVSYAQPYFYVTPWPYPANRDDAHLPGLPGGAVWHRTDWFGAVLTATAIFADANGSSSTRGELVARFLEVAASAAAALLG